MQGNLRRLFAVRPHISQPWLFKRTARQVAIFFRPGTRRKKQEAFGERRLTIHDLIKTDLGTVSAVVTHAIQTTG
ncbi:hypothetical protein HYPP_01629 [Hyphomicrobium sp. ghe19]|nr:hypothetical protein HYPP_01629 [Hyphomicrobium sp. ghe19]